MRLTRFVGIFVIATSLSSGCARYWVSERAFDAYAVTPRAQRKHVILPTIRDRDGAAALIRASEARPEPERDGTLRRVRVLRPLTVTGFVFLGTGAALVAAGLAVLFAPVDKCARSYSCGDLPGVVFSAPLLGFGGVELVVGSILSVTGAATMEVREPRGPMFTLRL